MLRCHSTSGPGLGSPGSHGFKLGRVWLVHRILQKLPGVAEPALGVFGDVARFPFFRTSARRQSAN